MHLMTCAIGQDPATVYRELIRNEQVSQGLHVGIPKWARCRCAPWTSEPQEKSSVGPRKDSDF